MIAAAITSNLRLAGAPGNVILKRRESRLAKDSVVNVSQLVTVNKSALRDRVGVVSSERLHEIEAGLRTILSL